MLDEDKAEEKALETPPVIRQPAASLAADAVKSELGRLQFPPAPTEPGQFRETITKQTLTETVIARHTRNQKDTYPIIIEVWKCLVYLFIYLLWYE